MPLYLILVGCVSSAEDTAANWFVPTLGEQIQVVPSAGLPDEVTVQDSANNLDVLEHEGALFLSFRTAPDHFASSETVLYVVRSDDGGETWDHELTLEAGTDLREPRFLSWEGELFLYYAVLGDDPLAFEPQGSRVVVRDTSGAWSEPAEVFDETFIPWRVRIVDGAPMLIGYTGGGEIYELGDGEYPEIEVQLLTSSDGRTWSAWSGERATVHTGGGSETDFAVTDEGALVAVMRNEAGDADGFGSKVCRAEAGDWMRWECVPDPRKYDSPLLFREGGNTWLLGRRNVTEDGAYDLGRDDLSHSQQYLNYQLAYWQEPKRCSLWHVDEQSLAVTWVLDLPSRGDTCFPSALDEGDGSWMSWNYSSDPDGDDIPWLEGQNGITRIYRQRISW